MGTQIQTDKTHLSTARPANYIWICVAPLPFNRSEISWDQIQTPRRCLEQFPACYPYKHTSFLRLVPLVILGNISPLQKRSLVPSAIQSTILFKNYSLWSFLINLGIKRGLFILLLFLLPVIFRHRLSVCSARRELHTLHLISKQGRDAGGLVRGTAGGN